MKNKPLVLGALAITLLGPVGCKQSNPAEESPAVGDNNSLSVTQQLQNAKEVASNAWETTKEVTTNAWVNVKESAQSAVDYTYDKKEAFVANATAELNALDEKTKELSDKVATASDSIKADAQAKLQELRDKRAVLGQKFDGVKNATEANWNEVKAGFQNAYNDTKDSLKQAWQWLADKLGS
jgi:tryptophan 2,3-dioxygenase